MEKTKDVEPGSDKISNLAAVYISRASAGPGF